jgi:hypothetical protein
VDASDVLWRIPMAVVPAISTGAGLVRGEEDTIILHKRVYDE